jgi:hypothetical protein
MEEEDYGVETKIGKPPTKPTTDVKAETPTKP